MPSTYKVKFSSKCELKTRKGCVVCVLSPYQGLAMRLSGSTSTIIQRWRICIPRCRLKLDGAIAPKEMQPQSRTNDTSTWQLPHEHMHIHMRVCESEQPFPLSLSLWCARGGICSSTLASSRANLVKDTPREWRVALISHQPLLQSIIAVSLRADGWREQKRRQNATALEINKLRPGC